jgi:hypothetical protein
MKTTKHQQNKYQKSNPNYNHNHNQPNNPSPITIVHHQNPLIQDNPPIKLKAETPINNKITIFNPTTMKNRKSKNTTLPHLKSVDKAVEENLIRTVFPNTKKYAKKSSKTKDLSLMFKNRDSSAKNKRS